MARAQYDQETQWVLTNRTFFHQVDHERMKAIWNNHDLHRFLRIGLLVTLLTVGAWGWNVATLGLSLQNRAGRLQQMAANPASINLRTVAQEVRGARQELTLLRSWVSPFLWLGARVGGDLGAGEPLMEAGVESLIAADELLNALAPSLGDLGLSSFSMKRVPLILDALVMARPALTRAESHLNAAAMAIARIQGPLSPRVERWVGQAGKLVEFAQYGIGAAQIAPALLGQNGSRTYLVLVQNSDEIRPAGGFISNFARAEISHGQLISMTIQDSYAIFDPSKYYPDPPAPLLEYMGSEQWLFRDANWSPDFPTTALDAVYLYQITRLEQVDGVIGVNLKGIDLLIAGLEPLNVPDLPEPVTVANASKILKDSWNPTQDISRSSDDWWKWYYTRKQVIGAAMRAAVDKLQAGKANWTRLGLGTIDALRQRQLMIYTSSPAANTLRRLRWDGALRPNQGDYLMIVDANIGFNKANVLVSQNADYQVALRADGTGRVTVILSYAHQGMKGDVVCMQIIPYDANVTYDKLTHTCYYDYLRLVVPRGSQLQQATAHPTPGEYLLSGKPSDGKAEAMSDETGRTIFGQFFVVEYGKQLETRFEYDLPVVVTDVSGHKRYSLLLQKQSGTDAMPVKVRLTLPDRARLVSASPRPVVQAGTILEFDLKLDTDRQIEVIYALAP